MLQTRYFLGHYFQTRIVFAVKGCTKLLLIIQHVQQTSGFVYPLGTLFKPKKSLFHLGVPLSYSSTLETKFHSGHKIHMLAYKYLVIMTTWRHSDKSRKVTSLCMSVVFRYITVPYINYSQVPKCLSGSHQIDDFLICLPLNWKSGK